MSYLLELHHGILLRALGYEPPRRFSRRRRCCPAAAAHMDRPARPKFVLPATRLGNCEGFIVLLTRALRSSHRAEADAVVKKSRAVFGSLTRADFGLPVWAENNLMMLLKTGHLLGPGGLHAAHDAGHLRRRPYEYRYPPNQQRTLKMIPRGDKELSA